VADSTKRLSFPVATCTLGAVAIFVFGYLAYTQPAREIRGLKETLAPYRVPAITYGGVTYGINEGVVTPTPGNARDERAILRIARFALVQRLDPMLALPGVDLDLLRKNIAHLKESQEAIVQHFSERGDRTFSAFYPIDFLEELATLESLRRTLFIEASDAHITAYNTSYNKALDAYETNAAAVQANMHATAPQHGAYRMWGGVVDNASTDAALSALRVASTRALDVQRVRMRCYEDGRAFQPIVPPTPEPPVRTEHAPETSPSMKEHEAIFDAFLAAAQEPIYTHYATERPKIAIANPACAPEQAYGYYQYWHLKDHKGQQGIRTENLADIYYVAEEGTNPYRAYMHDQGVPLEQQSSGNFYLCPEAGHDYGRIMSIASIQEQVAAKPLRAYFPELEASEEALLNADMLDETLVYTYLEALSRVLSAEGEVGFDTKSGGALFHAHELMAIWYAQSAGFDYALGNMANWNDHIIAIAPLLQLDPWFMAISRGYFSSLLLPYNRSFVGDTEITFFKERAALDMKVAGYESYRTGRYASLSADEFIKILAKSRDAAQRAIESL